MNCLFAHIFAPPCLPRSRTFFRRESRGEIDERKRLATLPFSRLPPSSLELTAAALHTSEAVELPRRPPWTATETKAALDARETAAFERWLEGVYARHTIERMNYFEHNLEVWRQLWRTVEMSDVLLLLADIRHPFFHFPVALYRAVVLEARKPLVLVLNKIDLGNNVCDESVILLHVNRFHRNQREIRVLTARRCLHCFFLTKIELNSAFLDTS
jgi:hypothetical protein